MICSCKIGWTGSYCEKKCHLKCKTCRDPGNGIDTTASDCISCASRAEMVDHNGTHQCQCLSGWEGPNCDHYTGTCHSLCQGCSGPTASDCNYCITNADWQRGVCICSYPYTGERCTDRLDRGSSSTHSGNYDTEYGSLSTSNGHSEKHLGWDDMFEDEEPEDGWEDGNFSSHDHYNDYVDKNSHDDNNSNFDDNNSHDDNNNNSSNGTGDYHTKYDSDFADEDDPNDYNSQTYHDTDYHSWDDHYQSYDKYETSYDEDFQSEDDGKYYDNYHDHPVTYQPYTKSNTYNQDKNYYHSHDNGKTYHAHDYGDSYHAHDTKSYHTHD